MQLRKFDTVCCAGAPGHIHHIGAVLDSAIHSCSRQAGAMEAGFVLLGRPVQCPAAVEDAALCRVLSRHAGQRTVHQQLTRCIALLSPFQIPSLMVADSTRFVEG